MPEHRRPLSIVARVREPAAGLAGLVDLARRLERAGATALIVDDSPAAPVEPFALLAALATATNRLGLIAATPVDEAEPYPLARRTATLDHVSHGRAGWLPSASHSERGSELLEVVTRLWDSVADDAVVADQASGRYLHADRRHAIEHRGRHFRVDGPLNLSRPPQGRPVLVVPGMPPARDSRVARLADVVVFDSVGDREAWDAALASAGRDASGLRFWLATDPQPESAAVALALAEADDPRVDGLVIDVGGDGTVAREAARALAAARRVDVSGDPAAGNTLRERLGLARPFLLSGRQS